MSAISRGVVALIYTRGEFNNASARRALVDWYLSLFIMCKACSVPIFIHNV